MKYVALLRVINVCGNNVIKMADLKACFEKNGFKNVSTYIQSGNVIFDPPAGGERQTEKMESIIENFLSKKFNYASKVLVRSYPQVKKILAVVPTDWKTRKDLRCYIAFIKETLTPDQALREVVVKEGIDFVKAGPGVLYMSTLLSGITKSRLSKLAG